MSVFDINIIYKEESNMNFIENKIILLDLNCTLAKKIKMNENFEYDVSEDVYRLDLVEKIKNNRIFIITARTDNYKEQTLQKIENDTGLIIERSYFKPLSMKYVKVQDFKKMIVQNLFQEGFKADDFFGLESNIKTREAYKSIGVKSLKYEDFMERIKK